MSSAMQLDYSIVDVFTEHALAGNPLAVVMNTAQLSTAQMQAIAVEFNLSETTFIERRDARVEQNEGVRVRIFTTQEELNFAGHPTLGTAAVLSLDAPETVRDGVVTLAENVGPIPVRLSSPAGSNAVQGEMTQRDPEFGPVLDRARVARLTGLDESDLDPNLSPQIVSTGTAFAIVPLGDAGSLGKLKVLHDETSAYLRPLGARWFYVLAPTSNAPGEIGPRYRARMQFHGGEDPATGSAAGCAISYLVNQKAVGSGDLVYIRQGVEMGRTSDLFLSAKGNSGKVTDVRVGGSTVLVAKGRIFLP